MTSLEEDLLAAMKELLETSEIMTSGSHFSAEDMARFHLSKERSRRVIALAEDGSAPGENINQMPLF